MDKKKFIQKWLDGSVSKDELEKMQNSEIFKDVSKMSESLKSFKAPDFQQEKAWNQLSLSRNKLSQSNLLKTIFRAAAVLAILIAGTYFFLKDQMGDPEMMYISSEERSEITLPDNSLVKLNAESAVAYDQNNWEDYRYITLMGEGYFEVAPGSDFEVMTTTGKIKVIGTSFNVKDRIGYFEVTCFEGKVNVLYEDNTYQLKPADQIRIIDGQIENQKISSNSPEWMQGKSTFQKVPYSQVIEELERQYRVNIVALDINQEALFTGSFTHDDISLALETITLPFNVNFSVKEDMIILSRDD